MAMHQLKWTVVAAILAAAEVAAGFVAGTAVFDASPASGSAVDRATSSAVAHKSTKYAISFPEANRAAKGNRLSVLVPDDQVGAASEQATKDWGNRSVQNRAPREGERKAMAHCELVGSPIANPVILHMPPRRCFARLETLTQYTFADSVALRVS